MDTIVALPDANFKPGQQFANMADSDHENMNRAQHRDAKRREPPSAAVVFETVRRTGESELARPLAGLAWSALAAGLSMGFSFVTQALLYTYTPDYAWRPIVASLGYSMGFLFVILGRQQLFTENTLTPVVELMRNRSLATFWRTAQLWVVVLAGNMLGVAIFVFTITHSDIFKPEVLTSLSTLASHEFGASFGSALMRGVFAGWLIALMMWLLPFAETARVGVIIIVTYVIGLAGFFHIVAGSVAALYAVSTGAHSFGEFLAQYFAPVLLGNIIGGVALVAAINYAQVSATVGSHLDD